MRALVTGANGFLGRHVVAALRDRGHAVRAMVRPSADLARLGWGGDVEVARGDLCATPIDDLRAAFDHVDVLVHLAATMDGGADGRYAATVDGTARLLEAMSETATRRIVLASSLSVYDWGRVRDTLDEDAPLESGERLLERDGYAVAKVRQEELVRRWVEGHRWELIVLRPGFLWGRGRAYVAGLGQKVGPIHLVFGPSTRLPLSHVENAAALFAAVVDDPRAVGQTFNVIDGDEVRSRDYLRAYLRRTGGKGLVLPIPYPLGYAATRAASALGSLVLRGRRLPSILVPRRFEARFKPLRYSDRKLRDVLGWRPPLDHPACLHRTYDGTTEQADG